MFVNLKQCKWTDSALCNQTIFLPDPDPVVKKIPWLKFFFYKKWDLIWQRTLGKFVVRIYKVLVQKLQKNVMSFYSTNGAVSRDLSSSFPLINWPKDKSQLDIRRVRLSVWPQLTRPAVHLASTPGPAHSR